MTKNISKIKTELLNTQSEQITGFELHVINPDKSVKEVLHIDVNNQKHQ